MSALLQEILNASNQTTVSESVDVKQPMNVLDGAHSALENMVEKLDKDSQTSKFVKSSHPDLSKELTQIVNSLKSAAEDISILMQEIRTD